MNIGTVTGKTERQTASWLKSARAVKSSPAEKSSDSTLVQIPAKYIHLLTLIANGGGG